MVTGTKKGGALSADLRLAMQSNATVVVYMGLKKAAEIADTYRQMGRGDTPSAVVQHVSLPQRKAAVGRVQDLPALVAAHGITYPALIVTGAVVALGQPAATSGPD